MVDLMIGCVSTIAVYLDKMSINDVLIESSHDRSDQCVLRRIRVAQRMYTKSN